jgi:hypothetical protein
MVAIARVVFAFLGFVAAFTACPAGAQNAPRAIVNKCSVDKSIEIRYKVPNAFIATFDFTNTSNKAAKLIDITLYMHAANGTITALRFPQKGTFGPGILIENQNQDTTSVLPFGAYACGITHIDYVDGTSWNAPLSSLPATQRVLAARALIRAQAAPPSSPQSVATARARPLVTTSPSVQSPVGQATKPSGILDAGSPVSVQSCAIGQYNGDGAQSGTFILTLAFTNESAKPVAAVNVNLLIASAEGKYAAHEFTATGPFAAGAQTVGKKFPSRVDFHIAKRSCKVTRVEYADGTVWNVTPASAASTPAP